MDCKACKNQLIFYIENSLPDKDKKSLDVHLSTCEDCNRSMKELVSYMNVIETEKALTSNPFLATRIIEKLNATNQMANKIWLKTLQPAVFTLVMIVALFAGIMLGNSYTSTLSYNGTVNQTDDLFFNEIYQENIENILIKETDYE